MSSLHKLNKDMTNIITSYLLPEIDKDKIIKNRDELEYQIVAIWYRLNRNDCHDEFGIYYTDLKNSKFARSYCANYPSWTIIKNT